MEVNYLDIEARIRLAHQQRDEAIGKLISAVWKECHQRMLTLREVVRAQWLGVATLTNRSVYENLF